VIARQQASCSKCHRLHGARLSQPQQPYVRSFGLLDIELAVRMDAAAVTDSPSFGTQSDAEVYLRCLLPCWHTCVVTSLRCRMCVR
jgi:hypothetical protein